MKIFTTLQLVATVIVPGKIADLRSKPRNERGSVTLEQAVIAGALFVAAVAVVAVIVGAINTNIGKIG